ncbi:cytoplasmic protein [Nonomuraea sp. WAC 01424]|uniref:cupin domain-containing protein n=1 Tax=Nonomuraea sp. WAC 01424 TaxID=2203200 RepID=UPI000F7A1253|nr:cytoplasmic protein [Nonomuraea sp. WAC 01424]RSM97170.1 cytoplasmic protein [Nonomuraea sp. WAC 01424]
MSADPVVTNPELYTVVFENDRVRVLRYQDRPGDATSPHGHPDSVMVTLSSFSRRLTAGGRQVELALEAGQARWVGAQEHAGQNVGDTESHAIFVELKEAPSGVRDGTPLGPDR